ncbi:MAG: hypothetical protein Q9182_006098 [Xanthomendoza sp. 2 TL-2023]
MTIPTLAILIHLTSYLCSCQTIGNRINQFNPAWHCNVDNFESTARPPNDCAKAYDSNDKTFWHSKYEPTDAPLPHHITIDLGKVYNTRSMTYLPRQDGNRNGNIGQWRISLSTNNSEFRLLNGTWKDDRSRKTVDFLFATPARYVRLDALTEAGGRGPWSSVAQIDIYEDNGSDVPSSSSVTTRQRPEPTGIFTFENGQTISLPERKNMTMGRGGQRTRSSNATATVVTNTTSTATETSTAATGPSSSEATATSGQPSPTTSPGQGVSGQPPGSDAIVGIFADPRHKMRDTDAYEQGYHVSPSGPQWKMAAKMRYQPWYGQKLPFLEIERIAYSGGFVCTTLAPGPDLAARKSMLPRELWVKSKELQES